MVVVVVWSEATWIYGLPNRGSPDLDHTTSITWRKAPVLCRFVAHNTYTFLNEGPKSIPAQRLWTLGPTKKYYGWRRTSLSRPETLHFSIIISAYQLYRSGDRFEFTVISSGGCRHPVRTDHNFPYIDQSGTGLLEISAHC